MASTSANIAGVEELAICPSTSATSQSTKRRFASEDHAPSAFTSGRPTKRVNKVPYHVFINHRGPDVKTGLATDLYNTLNERGLRVFLDSQELEWGDSFPEEIEYAMSTASLHLAIFSKNYAYSPWCLKELSFMLNTGTEIIPVFYYIEPEVVRYAKGDYADAFSQYEQKGRVSSETLQEWKDALKKVSTIVGHIIKTKDHETELLKEIARRAVKSINNVPLVVAEYPVGIDKAVEDFETKTLRSVEGHSTVQVVGICGMGGVGKTTLAKKIYNNKNRTVGECSFLLAVKDAAHKNDLHIKQKKLLKDLGFKGEEVENVEEGKGILARYLRSVRVLIVLDDVDNVEQLDALVPVKDNFRQGSLIVVTTRHFDVLTGWGISSSSIYRMKGLNSSHSKQLFCWHAFSQPFPKNGFAELAEKIIRACQGLPLSLKVLGRLFKGKSEQSYWESQLEKIARILPGDIMECLKVSYEALDSEEKEAFLDAACFFIGEHKSLAIEVWNGPEGSGSEKKGFCSWETLVNRCLIEVDEMDCISMHEHLRDLGRQLSLKQSPYRLWFPPQIIDVGNQAEKRISVRGIVATSTRPEWSSITGRIRKITGTAGSSDEVEEKVMGNSHGELLINTSQGTWNLPPSSVGLKVMVVKGTYFEKIIAEVSKDLVWLCWFNSGQRNLSSLYLFKNLRVLELYEDDDDYYDYDDDDEDAYSREGHRLEELYNADEDAPPQLRELVISGCTEFQRFPKSIGSLKHLKKILVVNSNKLKSLPEEFCSLQLLEHLELFYCRELRMLPDDFGNLRNLRYLDLSCCWELRKLPESIKELTLLQHLNLEDCGNLTLERDIFIRMTKLEYLNLTYCSVEELPDHITNQVSLAELHLYNRDLCELPINIGQLRKLRVLYIWSKRLTSLPTSLGDLSSLTALDIAGPQLKSLPPTLGDLSSLTELCIDCGELKCLPPNLGCLSSLSKLKIGSCSKLEYLPDSLGYLNLLEKLELDSSGVKSLPKSIVQLTSLQKLDIKFCPIGELNLGVRSFTSSLYNLKEISLQCVRVAKLSISEDCCPSLETLRFIFGSHLTEIEVLPISVCDLLLEGCSELRKIRAFGAMVNIKTLRILDCPKLEVLPSLAQLISLQRFELDGCDELKEIEGLEPCRSLETLEVNAAWEVSGIDCLKCMDGLRRVHLREMSRSAVEGCIQSMQKLPEETIMCTRAVPDAASRIASLAFRDCPLVHSLTHLDRFDLNLYFSGALEKKFSANGDAIIVCFVMNRFASTELDVNGSLSYYRWRRIGKVDWGNWVWIALLTQHSRWNKGKTVREMYGSAEAKGGLVAMGKEDTLKGIFLDLLRSVSE